MTTSPELMRKYADMLSEGVLDTVSLAFQNEKNSRTGLIQREVFQRYQQILGDMQDPNKWEFGWCSSDNNQDLQGIQAKLAPAIEKSLGVKLKVNNSGGATFYEPAGYLDPSRGQMKSDDAWAAGVSMICRLGENVGAEPKEIFLVAVVRKPSSKMW